jgi:hypothetical protein
MPAEVIVFPDVEDLTRVELNTRFTATTEYTTVTAYAGKKPATLPNEFVFVHRTGGPSRNLITDAAQITLEAYSKKSGDRASAILNLARAFLAAAERDGTLNGVPLHEVTEFSGGYLDPDPDAPTFNRYSATLSLAVRGTAA